MGEKMRAVTVMFWRQSCLSLALMVTFVNPNRSELPRHAWAHLASTSVGLAMESMQSKWRRQRETSSLESDETLAMTSALILPSVKYSWPTHSHVSRGCQQPAQWYEWRNERFVTLCGDGFDFDRALRSTRKSIKLFSARLSACNFRLSEDETMAPDASPGKTRMGPAQV